MIFGIGVEGQGQRLGSWSKVEIKVIGHGQRSNFRSTAVDSRSSDLPSVTKSNKIHYQSKVFVCVSVIWAFAVYCADAVGWLIITSCVRDWSLFMTGGGRRKTTFYEKNFRDPLGARTKKITAHSTLRDNFSTPTLQEYNRSIFIGKIFANCTCLKVVC